MSEQDPLSPPPSPTFMSVPMDVLSQKILTLQAQNALCDIFRLLKGEIHRHAAMHVHSLPFPPKAAPAVEACFNHLTEKTAEAILTVHQHVEQKNPEVMEILHNCTEQCESPRDWALRLSQTLESEGLASLCSPLPSIADEALGRTSLGSYEARTNLIEQVTTHVSAAFQAALSNTVGMALESMPICNPADAAEGYDLTLTALEDSCQILFPQEGGPAIKNPRTKAILESMLFALDTPLIDIDRALRKENHGFLAGEILGRSGYVAPLEALTSTTPFCDTPKGGMLCELHATLSGIKYNLMEDRLLMVVSPMPDQAPLETSDDPAYKAARRVCAWRLEKALTRIEDTLLDVSMVIPSGKARLGALTPDRQLPAPFTLQ